VKNYPELQIKEAVGNILEDSGMVTVKPSILYRFENHDIAFDQAMQELCDMGFAPNLVNDDEERWAVTDDALQNVPMKEPSDISISSFIRADQWKSTIREALLYHLKN
jgi:hypothetical protein